MTVEPKRKYPHKSTHAWRQANPDAMRRLKKSWNERNPERARAIQYKAHLKLRYNVTPEQVQEAFVKQNGACAICFSVSRKLVVDHDHDTGEFRGLLCRGCNAALGVVEANLDRIAAYLRSTQ